MTTRPTLTLAALLAALSPAAADPAKPGAFVMHEGTCSVDDFGAPKATARRPCAGEVPEIVFADGYSSVQFTDTDAAGRDLRRVAFIGPRWIAIDDTHVAMVLSQVAVTSLPVRDIKPTSPSGFCLFTLREKAGRRDDPAAIACEYDAGGLSRVYKLDGVTRKAGFDVK